MGAAHRFRFLRHPISMDCKASSGLRGVERSSRVIVLAWTNCDGSILFLTTRMSITGLLGQPAAWQRPVFRTAMSSSHVTRRGWQRAKLSSCCIGQIGSIYLYVVCITIHPRSPTIFDFNVFTEQPSLFYPFTLQNQVKPFFLLVYSSRPLRFISAHISRRPCCIDLLQSSNRSAVSTGPGPVRPHRHHLDCARTTATKIGPWRSTRLSAFPPGHHWWMGWMGGYGLV